MQANPKPGQACLKKAIAITRKRLTAVRAECRALA